MNFIIYSTGILRKSRTAHFWGEGGGGKGAFSKLFLQTLCKNFNIFEVLGYLGVEGDFLRVDRSGCTQNVDTVPFDAAFALLILAHRAIGQNVLRFMKKSDTCPNLGLFYSLFDWDTHLFISPCGLCGGYGDGSFDLLTNLSKFMLTVRNVV